MQWKASVNSLSFSSNQIIEKGYEINFCRFPLCNPISLVDGSNSICLSKEKHVMNEISNLYDVHK